MIAVSVIIPVYNAEKYLSECLHSVVGQDLNGLEIIIVNDGSTDSSPEIIQSVARGGGGGARCVIINHEKQLGAGAARNQGLACATGEFVCFMDSDDFYPEKGTLALLYRRAKDNLAMICGGSFSFYREDGSIFEDFKGIESKYIFSQEGFIQYCDYQFDYGYHRFIYNRTFLMEHKIVFPHYKRFEDPPFFVKAMVSAGQFYAVPCVVYRYRIGHQVKSPMWGPNKLHDLFKGYLDNLALSQKAGLADLHSLTLWRIENEYRSEILKNLYDGDYKLMSLLAKLNCAVDIRLLETAGIGVGEEDYYLIGRFKDLVCERNALSAEQERLLSERDRLSVEQERLLSERDRLSVEQERLLSERDRLSAERERLLSERDGLITEISLIYMSISYRLGRIATFIPRKIRQFLCIYKGV